MQPTSYYPPPPRRGCSPLAVVGTACGGCLLIAIILAVGAVLVGSHFVQVVQNDVSATVPPPRQYVGVWTSAAGDQTLTIGANGRGSFHGHSSGGMGNSNVSIDGGRVTVDEAHHILSVTFLNFGETKRLEKPPHRVDGRERMTLDGVEFERTSPSQPADTPHRTGGSPSSEDI